jgi:imidazolonepropionase-like amidohydrolase
MIGRALATAILALVLAPASSGASILAVRARMLRPVVGPPIANGVVVVRDGKIVAVGPAARTSIPEGADVLEAAVVIPGLVDAHTVVGLSGLLNQPQDQDQLERSEPIQPELRAIDAYNARDELVAWVRSFGVTTIHAGHAPGTLVSGQTMIAKTRGTTVDQAVIVPEAMVATTFGDAAMHPDREKGKAPGTRSKVVAMLRQDLIRAQEYVTKRGGSDVAKRPERSLRQEALARVLAREVPLLVTVQRHQDILSVLRVAREFGIRVVLDGAAEAHLVLDEIRAAGVAVLPHPPMQRAWGEMENATMELAARLDAAKIPFAFQSGFESYVPKTRVLLFETAIGAANGLGPDRALEVATIEAARILGIAERVGSIEVGKDGDLALYDGDPFEYTTHCIGVVIEGQSFPGEAH